MKPIPAIIFTLLIFLNAAPFASAATNPVTSTADSGAGTLRQALANAADGDTIDASGVSGTILLTSGELLVTKSLTIFGPGPASLAVDGNAASRVFYIAPGNAVSISSLTITNGSTAGYGGGIYNDGSILTVSNSTIAGNTITGGGYGGGICNNGSALTIAYSTIAGNSLTAGGGYGGGIYNNGSLTIAYSTLRDNSNSFDRGGAIYNDGYNDGTVTITNSTLNGNHAGIGGGIYNDGTAGWATLIIANSSLSGNSADDGGGIYNDAFGFDYFNGVYLWINNSTLSGNSGSSVGGIYQVGGDFGGGGAVSIHNTILNAGASGANLAIVGDGTIIQGSFNLSSDGGGGLLTGANDQLNTDPHLGPLQDNGGPTFTHALLPASPAIDQGRNFSDVSADQRGFPRPVDFPSIPNAPGGDGSDIGAFEVQTIALGVTLTVNTTIDNTAADDFLTLREAILLVNNGGDAYAALFRPLTASERKQISGRFGGNDSIRFDTSAFGTIRLTNGELLVWRDVAIVGPGPVALAVDGNAASRVFHNHRNTVIANLTITNGLVTDVSQPGYGGGGIWNDHGALTVSNCIVSGNSATFGGGIYNDGDRPGSATLALVNCVLSGNSANVFGGGIYNNGRLSGAMLTVANCTLNGNSAYGGGGVYNDGVFGSATLTIANSTFSRNSGVGIVNNGQQRGQATLTIANSTLSGNAGGNIGSYGGQSGSAMLTIVDSTLSDNSDGNIVNDGPFGVATVSIGGTILQTGASGGNIGNSLGVVTSDGYNLSSDNGSGFLTNVTDQINTDPMLGPLQDNGGPTFTHALLCGSPAIDRGWNFTTLATDQRGDGFDRTVDHPALANMAGGDGTDIGAFEVQQGVCPLPDTDGDGVPDPADQCPDTRSGDIVDAAGCSIAQLVPCEGPGSGGKWKNHGQYVRAVLQTATDFLKARLITRRQWGHIVTGAARSKCGWNRRSDHDGDRDWHRDWDCDHDAYWGRGRNGSRD